MQTKRSSLFEKIMWDYSISPEQIEQILAGNDKALQNMIYRKILMSSGWYNILEVLSKEELSAALQEDVIKTIFIPSIREKYQYAATILFR